MVYYGPKHVVETGSYDIRNFFRPARSEDGKLITEEDKMLPPVTWDPEVERRLLRKLDLRITFPVWFMYVIAYIDRVNLGNVKVLNAKSPDSIENSLGTQGVEFNWAISLAFWGFLIAEIPSNIMLKKFSARVWLARIMVTWGIVVMCMAACKNAAGLLAARFFLGLCEAGLIPGVFYYFSFWFKPTERATRNGWFYSASGFAGGVSGLLAIAMEGLNGVGGLKAWQWVFILEGAPAVILGTVLYFVLLEFPHSQTSYLTPEEQDVAIRRLPSHAPSMHDKNFIFEEAITVFAQPAHWLFMLSYVCMSVGILGAANFLPSILGGMGYTTALSANFMSAWPNFAAIFYYVGNSWHSDYTRERVWHGIIPTLVCFIGSALLTAAARNPPTATDPGFIPNSARYALFFFTTFQTGAYPVLVNFRASTLKGSTEVGLGISSTLVCQAIASIIAPFLFPNSDAPQYVPGMTISTVLFGVGSLTYAAIPLALRYQNYLARKWQKENGIPEELNEVEKKEVEVKAAPEA
ncbi:MFS general substrate transporter [Gonapodya prolifera JEL478]|uniref:MFS general substrate transporter n=1 Tax=Gonapodya prolifera (strain JEL478) TaxID=1344416 RepID=A0A139A4H9_GONPJ|nr:MFS general substrate transporter [Gonapodya prolifera JEL478]|eukprot:KXS11702.1 MFS general substrate transporter [Gonapodya prolifera JEL478]